MSQKVIQVGNSAAITIPKEILEEVGLSIGDRIAVTSVKKAAKIEVIPWRRKVLRKKSGINKAFTQSVDEFIDRYRNVLEELAKR